MMSTAVSGKLCSANGKSIPDGIADTARLIVSGIDRPRIVSNITGCLSQFGANIIESQQFSTEAHGGLFFLRIEFHVSCLRMILPELELALTYHANAYGLSWRLVPVADVKRMAIMVSREEHALNELLMRWRSGDFLADISMVISNHPHHGKAVESLGIPYHYIPVTPDTKSAAEDKQLELLSGNVDFVVLARYMQILSPRFVERFPYRIINIHHGLLPAFAGANPYRAAKERGVKLIGATAHYVTSELDAGPIIEQDVTRVDHRHGVAELRRRGSHLERSVLATAVSWHVQDRVIVHGNSTITFTN
ncbi:formyltetrahydrofolate deformylase [Haloechinothrix salitolerans]|uniref:Formyltetrahydrofolate deformylase n=1 Tax=Haloechinothrix salitolerans TaxID=926830 RepID=A0ABW2BV42_9PSEU